MKHSLRSLVGTLGSLPFANAQAAGNTPHSPRKYFCEELVCGLRRRANGLGAPPGSLRSTSRNREVRRRWRRPCARFDRGASTERRSWTVVNALENGDILLRVGVTHTLLGGQLRDGVRGGQLRGSGRTA